MSEPAWVTYNPGPCNFVDPTLERLGLGPRLGIRPSLPDIEPERTADDETY